ncbi:MAG TPA: hypothetical protein VFX33_15505 [Actinomycetales bacterium]|nr:hypothetical protein [Actinomycetales bacterium]
MTEPMTEHTSQRTGEPTGPSQPEAHRCRACGARLTAAAPWCSLCFTPITADAPGPHAQPDGDTHVRAHATALEPIAAATQDGPSQSDPTRGDPTQDGPSQDEEAHQLADELMARLAAERPAPSRWAGLAPSSGPARAALSVVGVVLVTGLAFALMALLGSFL